MIRFLYPELLLLVLVIPLVGFLRQRLVKPAALMFPTTEGVKQLEKIGRNHSRKILSFLRVLSSILLIIALARPQLVRGSLDVEASGIDIMLAIDVSGSMEALDFKLHNKPANRLEVVKSVVRQFIDQRPNDRIGIVSFAGRPYLTSPLTLDHSWIQGRLVHLKIGLIEDGTAIGSALATAVNRLRDQESKSKIIVLLTDGMNNAGKVLPQTAAEAARALNVKVYTIAAGSRGEAPMPVKDMFGRKRIVMAKVDVDEEALKRVAEVTGGQFYRATDTDSLQRIYEEINKLETTTHKMKRFEYAKELFFGFAVVALCALFLEIILGETILRRLP